MIDKTLEDQSYKDNLRDIRDETWANRGHAAELVAKYIIEKYQTLVSESIGMESETPKESVSVADTPEEIADPNVKAFTDIAK